MAIETYINAMDRFSQAQVIPTTGIKEVSNGMCMMLSILWVTECANPHASAPNVVLQEMKNLNLLKQIAQNHSAYSRHYAGHGWLGSMICLIPLISSRTRSVLVRSYNDQQVFWINDFPAYAANALAQSTLNTRCCVIVFSLVQGGAHCIAMCEWPVGLFYLFDPNFGVMIIDSRVGGPGHTLDSALRDVWICYNILRAECYTIVR